MLQHLKSYKDCVLYTDYILYKDYRCTRKTEHLRYNLPVVGWILNNDDVGETESILKVKPVESESVTCTVVIVFPDVKSQWMLSVLGRSSKVGALVPGNKNSLFRVDFNANCKTRFQVCQLTYQQ